MTLGILCQFRPTARRSECLVHTLVVRTATWFVRTATCLVRWGIVAAATSVALVWLLGAGDGGSGVVPSLIAMVSDVLSGHGQDAAAIASGGGSQRARSRPQAWDSFDEHWEWQFEEQQASPFCPGLDEDATFGSKNFLRSRLVRSLHGSTARSTERPIAPVPREVAAHQESDQLPTERFNGAGGLNTVVKEDLEDWVDDFEAISLSEVPLGVEGVSQGGAGATAYDLKTSRRSRKSLHRDTELRLILDFPLPPTFIPSPTKSRTPSSALPPPEVTPIHDDGSVFYDRDPFRVKSTHDQEVVEEEASLNIPDAIAPRVDSSMSFYTAHS
ncbi:hypothetical protein F5148DRAFT_1366547 [Russula earlei]|uniref:Uncharacterized protein n=1 Tax=Russula earlei TaxID=71964 RepID=A0ACC0UFE2_9AGAM|nr:hypothetical protein F5148DRAFT_1366547 [Russula earlei]